MSLKRSSLIACILLTLFVISAFEIYTVTGKPRVTKPNVDSGGPYNGTEGQPISFDSSATYDPDGRITSWIWDFGDGQTSTEQNPTHTYLQDGTYSVKLLITYPTFPDEFNNATDEDSTTAEVTDTNPEANFSLSLTSGFEPLSITFSDQSTTYDGIISWLWDFGDGQTSTEQNPTHIYTEGKYTVSLTVEEEDGDIDTITKPNIINVEHPPNAPPEADFTYQSSAKTSINELISFTDHSSDIDGTITSWFWDFGDGTTSTQKNPTHQYSNIGTFTISLTVKDDDSATNKASKQITIYETNPPITIHDYDNLWHTNDFSINLLATDDHSGVAETYYKINDGPTQKLSDNGQPKITTEGPNNVIEYWSIDNVGNEETHHILSDIKLDKTFPTADAGSDITTEEDTVVTLTSNSHDNIQIANYTWIFFDDGLKTVSGANPQYIFHNPGVYNITLIIADSALNSASDSITIIVRDVTKPVANAGNDRAIHEGDIATFDGSKSTDNVEIVSYVWTFTDVSPQTLKGANPSYAFSSVGGYEITLTVSDEQGNFATDIVLVTVTDTTMPLANAGVDQIVLEDTAVYFDGSASYDNVGIVSYAWTFTDGKNQSLKGEKVEYYFETPGKYLITLEVTDAESNTSNDSILVIVQAKAASIIQEQNNGTVVEQHKEDDADESSDMGESLNELDIDSVSASDSDTDNSQQNEATSPSTYTFYGRSLADVLTIFLCVFTTSFVLFSIKYSRRNERARAS